jgi:hypothetical protein
VPARSVVLFSFRDEVGSPFRTPVDGLKVFPYVTLQRATVVRRVGQDHNRGDSLLVRAGEREVSSLVRVSMLLKFFYPGWETYPDSPGHPSW